MTKTSLPDSTTHFLDRTALRRAYRVDEDACVTERLEQAASARKVSAAAAELAINLIEGARAHKASGIDAFLQQYGLDTDEGIALMCLAEALLRVPDDETADALIRDKIGEIDWGEHLGESSSTFVNAATFSLMLTGEVLEQPEAHQTGMGGTLKRTMNRLGEPVIRKATLQAMRILGGQFVFGRTINEALKRAKPERAKGLTHSFDMLGEAAMTFADAERYRVSYDAAIERLAKEAKGGLGPPPAFRSSFPRCTPITPLPMRTRPAARSCRLLKRSPQKRATPTFISPSTQKRLNGSKSRSTLSKLLSPMMTFLCVKMARVGKGLVLPFRPTKNAASLCAIGPRNWRGDTGASCSFGLSKGPIGTQRLSCLRLAALTIIPSLPANAQPTCLT